MILSALHASKLGIGRLRWLHYTPFCTR